MAGLVPDRGRGDWPAVASRYLAVLLVTFQLSRGLPLAERARNRKRHHPDRLPAIRAARRGQSGAACLYIRYIRPVTRNLRAWRRAASPQGPSVLPGRTEQFQPSSCPSTPGRPPAAARLQRGHRPPRRRRTGPRPPVAMIRGGDDQDPALGKRRSPG